MAPPLALPAGLVPGLAGRSGAGAEQPSGANASAGASLPRRGGRAAGAAGGGGPPAERHLWTGGRSSEIPTPRGAGPGRHGHGLPLPEGRGALCLQDDKPREAEAAERLPEDHRQAQPRGPDSFQASASKGSLLARRRRGVRQAAPRHGAGRGRARRRGALRLHRREGLFHGACGEVCLPSARRWPAVHPPQGHRVPRSQAREHPGGREGVQEERGPLRGEALGLRALQAHQRRLQHGPDPGGHAAVLGAGG
mmetsp:Transcript_22509/g.63906  ORF Transcript_22509/g.63906 Transcript_22509/m.63906 type:complete len:252 (-) Transcript_22509:1069-1824(-)